MENQTNTDLSFDHLPSPEELTAQFAQAEQDDPRSIFYKRVLIRPKLPFGRILLFLCLCILVFTLTYWGVYCLSCRVHLAVLSAIGALLLLFCLFAKQLLIGFVRIYQAIAPKKLRNRCRYEPSCSVYMILAVKKYGFWKGLSKGLVRWKGCKPPNGGFDIP